MGRGADGGDKQPHRHEELVNLDPKNLWCIQGKRYDLRQHGFLDKHPGGRHHLELSRGRDVTELFESYHALVDAPHQMMSKYLVKDQDLVPELSFDWSKEPVYQSLKTKIRAHFTDEGIKRGDHKCDAAAWARYTLFTFMFCVSTYAWLQGEWWSLIGMPWFYWLGPSGLMHSGSHSALSKIPWVNRAGAYAGSAHVSALHWYHQHVIGHHCHTNIEGYDPDLTHFQHEEDASPGYRLHADQPWFDKYDTWRSAMPMQAFFSSSGPALLNQPLYLMAQKFGCTPVLNQSPLRTLWHILGRLAIIYAAFVHPFRIFELQKAFFFAAFPYGFHGMIFFGFSQVSHLNEDLMEAQLDIPMARKREWAAHQILTCCDYNTDSLLWRTLSIGLNAQAIHHLFPGIEPCHYGPLSQMLKDTCEEHNLPYTNFPNFVAAIQAHVSYVASINVPNLETDKAKGKGNRDPMWEAYLKAVIVAPDNANGKAKAQ